MNPEPRSSLAFVAPPEEAPAIEIGVNFGAFTGRTVMLAEIDRLAGWLLDEVEAVTVIAEERHLIGRLAEGSVHQVRIAISNADAPEAEADRNQLERRLLERIDYWVRLCIAERHVRLVE